MLRIGDDEWGAQKPDRRLARVDLRNVSCKGFSNVGGSPKGTAPKVVVYKHATQGMTFPSTAPPFLRKSSPTSADMDFDGCTSGPTDIIFAPSVQRLGGGAGGEGGRVR